MKSKQLGKIWESLLTEFPELSENYDKAQLDLLPDKRFVFRQGGFQGDSFLEIAYCLPSHSGLEKLKAKLSDDVFVETAWAASTGYLFPSGFRPELRADQDGHRTWHLVCEISEEVNMTQLRGYLAAAVLLGDAYLSDLFATATETLGVKQVESGLTFENFRSWARFLLTR